MWKMRVWVLLAAAALPGLMLLPVWRLAGLGAGEDDLLYYFPTRAFFHESIQGGHWPWLNPWTGLGRPFVADPQTAAWYPATWLFAGLDPLWAYPLSLWLHYGLALWGMYRLLRDWRLDRRAALFSGIVFAFCGFMLAHRAHLTMQYAGAWAPIVFWQLQRYTRSGDGRSLPKLAAAAFAVAMQCFAGHVQIALLTGIGALVFLLVAARPLSAQGAARSRRRTIVVRWLLVWVCAGGLFAVQWLPTIIYVRQCTRVDRSYLDFTENSWNPASLVGWVLPMVYGQRTPNFFAQPYWGPSHQVEQFAYVGILPLLLAAAGLRGGWRGDPRRRPWVVLGILGVLLALGRYGPICPILYALPGSNLFRVPARALLLLNLALAALAAITLHDMGPRLSPQAARIRATLVSWTRRWWLVALLLVFVPAAAIAAALPWMGATLRAAALASLAPWRPALWVPLVVAGTSLAVLGWVVRRWQRPGLLWLPLLVTGLDLGIIGWTLDVPSGVSSASQLITPADGEWMNTVRTSPHRLWVVTQRQDGTPGEYHDPVNKAVANTNMLRRIYTLQDYGPLQPRGVVERFGFHPWGESWRADALLADTGWTSRYNVGWILLCEPTWPPPEAATLVTTTADGYRLFRQPRASGWVTVEPASLPAAMRFERRGPSAFTVHVDTWAAEDGDNAARVIVSQLALPGWEARLAGQRLRVDRVDGVLMGVRIPTGARIAIDFAYEPPGWRVGLAMTLASLVVLGAVWMFGGRAEAGGRGRG
jgi:hypothetical protein